MEFELSDLRVFIRVAEAPSLTQGARRAHLSPAAVSARIKAMETKLGAKLLYRDNRGVMLTPAGQTLLKHARLILRQVDYAKEDFVQFESGTRGHIRIFANTTAATVFLPELLPGFLADYPAITIDLQERFSREIVRGVLEGSADIGLIAGVVEAQGLEVIHYSTIRLVLAVPLGHPLAEEPCITFARALEFPHISLHDGSTLYDLLAQEAGRIGRVLRTRIQVSSYQAIYRMLSAGVGVAILPESATLHRDLSEHFTTLPLVEPWTVRERSVLVRELAALPAYVRELIERIRGGENNTHAIMENYPKLIIN